jgi:hypothetical protein
MVSFVTEALVCKLCFGGIMLAFVISDRLSLSVYVLRSSSAKW